MAELIPRAITSPALTPAQTPTAQTPTGSTANAYVQPLAGWSVSLDGQDLTEALRPRLVSLSLTEKRGEEADELEIILHDGDGAMALPAPGAVLTVAIGWVRGTAIAIGLVAKGRFKVDEVTWEGPPDSIRITARAADLGSALTTRRTASWVAQTLGAIITTIATRHSLTARVHPSLARLAVAAQQQEAKSDIAFIRDLGRRYDATATIKDGHLLFAPIGAATTVSGRAIPATTIQRSTCSRFSWTRKKRDDHDGVQASWHDQRGARRQHVEVGGTSNPRRLRRTYATAADATAAANAARARDQRNNAECSLSLPHGDASLSTGHPVTLAGFKTAIDATRWQIAEIHHEVGPGGFATDIKLDVGASG